LIEVTQFGDVRRVRMWTRRTLAAGYHVSAYLVRGILVDCGFRHVGGGLEQVLRQLRPRAAIVTHWHEDHAGNAPAMARAGLPLWMHALTEQKLRERQQVKLYRHVVWGRPAALVGSFERFEPDALQLIATPGHSADHHIVFDPDTRTIVAGDLWLGVKVRVIGYDENPYQIIASLNTAIALRPKRLFDAHRGLLDDPVAALTAKRDWVEETVAAIERRLAAGDPEEIVLREVLDGEEHIALWTRGEYSRRNFVRAVARVRG
jgi:glyoxylase-like metal-dependent hydrolase (beta-lactamase superfamily II)